MASYAMEFFSENKTTAPTCFCLRFAIEDIWKWLMGIDVKFAMIAVVKCILIRRDHVILALSTGWERPGWRYDGFYTTIIVWYSTFRYPRLLGIAQEAHSPIEYTYLFFSQVIHVLNRSMKFMTSHHQLYALSPSTTIKVIKYFNW